MCLYFKVYVLGSCDHHVTTLFVFVLIANVYVSLLLRNKIWLDLIWFTISCHKNITKITRNICVIWENGQTIEQNQIHLKYVKLMFQTRMIVRANRARMAGHVQMAWTDIIVDAVVDTLAPTAKWVRKTYCRLLRHQIMTTKHSTTLSFKYILTNYSTELV